MRKTLIVLAALASTPALAEMDRGGNGCVNGWFRSVALFNRPLIDPILKNKSVAGAAY